MSIQQKIRGYHGDIEGKPHHRYRSWEHCYGFFQQIAPAGIAVHRDTAALQLGFYLASWGMYRGSSFHLQLAYTAHLAVIDRLAAPEFLPLWETEFGSEEGDSRLVPIIELVIQAVRDAYAPFQPTDTLVTKVILGTFGCLPACDRYFVGGFKSQGLRYSCVNTRFIERVRSFCRDNLAALREEQSRIENGTKVRYPLMKLIDMYFWQIGYEQDTADAK